MKMLAITEFKSHSLQILSEVSVTKEHIIVTKRGKPLVEVVPYSEEKPVAGKLSDTLVFEKDILTPLGDDDWGASK